MSADLSAYGPRADVPTRLELKSDNGLLESKLSVIPEPLTGKHERKTTLNSVGCPTMPIDVYQDHVLDPDQLEALRMGIEKFETPKEVGPELRGVIERN